MTWFLRYKQHEIFNYLKTFSLLTKKIFSQLNCCELCGLVTPNNQTLCIHCSQNLPYFKYDKVQGDLLNWPEIYRNLPNIQFDHLIALAPHDKPFQPWLSQFKYQGKFELAYLLGKLLATHYLKLQQQFNLPIPDSITCVPIHIKRWQQRGFNQTHLLSQQFIKHLSALNLNLTYKPNLIQRKLNTEKQVEQTGKARRTSLKNAFCLTTNKTLPKHIMLIDDVVTTGATASEISTLLKKQGVETVTLITVTLALAKQGKMLTL